jgi:pyrimidine-specific ribonucleoside hydrolase
VDTGLGAGRGQTLVDRRAVSAAPDAVEVAETVDSAAAVAFLVERLASLDAGGPARPAVSGNGPPGCSPRCRG